MPRNKRSLGLLLAGLTLLGCTRAPVASSPSGVEISQEARGDKRFKLTTSQGYFKFVNRADGVTRYHNAPEIVISQGGLLAADADKSLTLEPLIIVTGAQQSTLTVCPDGIVTMRDESGTKSKLGRVTLTRFEHPDKLRQTDTGYFEAVSEAGAATSFVADGNGRACV